MPFDADGEEYEEYPLYSNGKGGFGQIPHHVMKVISGSRNLNLESLIQPLIMFRARNVLDENALKEKEKEKDSLKNPKKNALFKKKSKQYFLGREAQDVVLGGGDHELGALIAPINSRFGDPDRIPWQLKDADGQVLTGSLEGSQISSHVLFLSHLDGFKVIPVSKWYQFKPKPTHRTLTIDEAEEKMKSQKKANDRWLMRAEAAEKEGKSSGGTASKKEKPIKAWRQKLMGIDPDVKDEKIQLAQSKKSAVPRDGEDLEELGIDFEEGFSDDDDINFGMDDQEEAKEAKKRIFGKGVAGEVDHDPGVWKDSTARRIAKSLVKREKQEVYTDMGPENPYWSSDDDDDLEEDTKATELQPNTALEKLKKAKLQPRTGSQNSTPGPTSSKASSSKTLQQQYSPPAKRQRVNPDDTNSRASSAAPSSRPNSQSPPPPPSAAQVIKNLARLKRKGSRGPSASPAPSSSSPSALSLDYTPLDPTELTAQALISAVNSKPRITVREVASALKPFLQSGRKEENVQKLKELMKTYCNHDKKSGVVVLKKDLVSAVTL